MREQRFDLVVIGSGPAGEKGAAQAAYHGYSVALVERDPVLGGAVVNNAGIPTKTLREAGLYLTGFRDRRVYGLTLSLDRNELFGRAFGRASEVTSVMARAVEANLARHQVRLFRGSARFAGERVVEVEGAGGTDRLRGDVVLIAPGSVPSHPPGVDFGDPDVLDSDTVVRLQGGFDSIVVIGGGAIALEYASIFAALGVEVTLVHRRSRALPVADAEATELLTEVFRSMGIEVRLDQRVAGVQRRGGVLEVSLEGGATLRPAKVLFAAGRRGNTDGLCLDATGVGLDERGYVAVDGDYATTAPGVYAAGDVIGPPGLASVSMEQARVAMCKAFGISLKDSVDPLVPMAVYSVPELAWVGTTEQQAEAAGTDYEVGRASFGSNSRAAIAGHPEGMIKLIADATTHRLIGVHIVGDEASELIHIGQAAMHAGVAVEHFIDSTFNVPTRSDLYKYAAYDALTQLERREGSAPLIPPAPAKRR